MERELKDSECGTGITDRGEVPRNRREQGGARQKRRT